MRPSPKWKTGVARNSDRVAAPGSVVPLKYRGLLNGRLDERRVIQDNNSFGLPRRI